MFSCQTLVTAKRCGCQTQTLKERSVPAEPCALTFEGARTPVTRGQHSPGPSARSSSGTSKEARPEIPEDGPGPLVCSSGPPVYLRRAWHRPGRRLCAVLSRSFSGRRRPHGVSQSPPARSLRRARASSTTARCGARMRARGDLKAAPRQGPLGAKAARSGHAQPQGLGEGGVSGEPGNLESPICSGRCEQWLWGRTTGASQRREK